jgi:hypothetical protein
MILVALIVPTSALIAMVVLDRKDLSEDLSEVESIPFPQIVISKPLPALAERPRASGWSLLSSTNNKIAPLPPIPDPSLKGGLSD